MTLQQWLFSIKGRIGRRDFWIWIAIWAVTMVALFSLAGGGLVDLQTAAFMLVCLLWPTAAVTIKRLHDLLINAVLLDRAAAIEQHDAFTGVNQPIKLRD